MSSAKNTPFRVELAARASLDLKLIFEYIDGVNSLAAANWYNRLEAHIESLNHLPDRGTPVKEDATLRQVLHGNKPHVYRVLYRVDNMTARVIVVHIRHNARHAFQPQDLQ